MKAYKLTDENGQTKNNTQWGPGVSHTANGKTDQPLCSDGWIHFYSNSLVAVFMNPIHANFQSPRLWEAETSGEELHEPLKSGCKTLTTIKEIPVPEVTLTQRIAFGILSVKEVYHDEKWNSWADKWLNGEDRTPKSAAARANAAAAAAAAAAAYAARANAAARAAAAYAARAAAAAADAAYAARAAAAAADACAHTAPSHNLIIKLAEEAMTYK